MGRTENGWHNHLNDDQRRDIARLYLEDGVPTKRLMELFSASQNQVYLALQRFGAKGGRRGWFAQKGVRVCKSCGNEQPLGAFRSPGGVALGQCRQCRSKGMRKYNLRTRFFTEELFRQRHAEQDGKCAICGKKPKVLCADHCHQTNTPRGLLCHRCNQQLGKFENPNWLAAAQAYLARYRQ